MHFNISHMSRKFQIKWQSAIFSSISETISVGVTYMKIFGAHGLPSNVHEKICLKASYRFVYLLTGLVATKCLGLFVMILLISSRHLITTVIWRYLRFVACWGPPILSSVVY